MALAIYLRFIHAISYERLARLFRALFGLGVSEGGLNAMLQRAKPCFDKQVEAILSRLRKTRVICSDETSVRIDGVNWWNWVFQNDGIVLHVSPIETSWEVVEEVLDVSGPVYPYEPGTWGPAEADRLVTGFQGWHNPSL